MENVQGERGARRIEHRDPILRVVELLERRVADYERFHARVERGAFSLGLRLRPLAPDQRLRAPAPGLIERGRRKAHPARHWPRCGLPTRTDAA